MDEIKEIIEKCSSSVVNIINENVYIAVNDVDSNVNDNVNNVNTFVNNNVYRPKDLDMLQTLLDNWAKEALKDLQRLLKANGE